MADLTPTQLFTQLVNELSASGSVPLPAEDPSRPNLTLREAVGAILWKNTFLLPLTGRPNAPQNKDDLYGHVLSLRAEVLQLKAVLEALAAKASIDVASIDKTTIASFQ